MSKETEVQGGSSNLAEVVKYIAERSQNIANYSDKLSKKIKELDDWVTPIAQSAGVKIDSNLVIATHSDKWGATTKTLSIRKITAPNNFTGWGLVVKEESDSMRDASYTFLQNASGAVKVGAIKQLPAFLQEYAQLLQKNEQEFEQVAEKAERMAQAISS